MTNGHRAMTRAKKSAIIAHRGGARLWPENSMLAIEGARALDVDGTHVDGIEVDVHLTKDDAVVVLHDATLDRTTTSSGPVRARTAAELRDVAVKDKSGAVCAHGLPLLDDLLRTFAGTTATLSIELKNGVGDARYEGLAARVVEALDRFSVRERAFVHAFDWSYLSELKDLAPNLALGGNVERGTLDLVGGLYAIMARLRELEVRDINVDHRLMDADLVLAAHEHGLQVTLWTVNDPQEIERFMRAGVDTLVTDRPDVALAIRRAFLDEIGLRA